MVKVKEGNILAALDGETPTAALGEREGNIRLVCFMAAQGDTQEAIARKLDLSETFVDAVLSTPSGADMVVRLQATMFPDTRSRLTRLSNVALDKKTKILLTSQNEALVNTVATDILDRVLGKATQVTESRNFNFNASDMESLDRAIASQGEKLKKLDEIELRLRSAQVVTPEAS